MPINLARISLVIVGIVISGCAAHVPIATTPPEQGQASMPEQEQASKWDGVYVGSRANTNSGARGCGRYDSDATMRVVGGKLLARLAMDGTREGIPINDDGTINDQRGRNFVAGRIDGESMTLTFTRGMECSYKLVLRKSDAQ